MTGRKINEKGAVQIAHNGGISVASINEEECCCKECRSTCIHSGDKQPDYVDLIISGFRVCQGCHSTEWDSVIYETLWGDFNGHYRLKKTSPGKNYACFYQLGRAVMKMNMTTYDEPGCRGNSTLWIITITDIIILTYSYEGEGAWADVAPFIKIMREDGYILEEGPFYTYGILFEEPKCCSKAYLSFDDFDCTGSCRYRDPIHCTPRSAYEVIPYCPP